MIESNSYISSIPNIPNRSPEGQLGQRTLRGTGYSDRLERTMKLIQVALQCLWVDLLIVFSKLSTDAEKKGALRQKGEHLHEYIRYLKNIDNEVQQWGEQLVVPAFNVTKASAAFKTAQYERERDRLFAEANFDWHLGRKVSPMTKGLCAGVSLDYAQKLLALAQQHPLDSAEFKRGMATLAHKYKYGVGKKGYALQMLYARLATPSEEVKDLSSENLKHLIHYYIELYRKGEPLEELLERAEQLMPMAHSYLSELNLEFAKQVKGEKGIDLQAFYEIIYKHPEHVEALFPLCQLYVDEVNKLKIIPYYRDLESAINDSVEPIDALRASHLKPKGFVKLQHHLLVRERTPVKEYKKIVAEQLGMQLIATERAISERKSDAENIDEITQLPHGIYEVSILMGEGRHALLIIRAGDEDYIWDPNVGLLDTERHLGTTFKKLLSSYDPNGQHGIQIREVRNKSKEG